MNNRSAPPRDVDGLLATRVVTLDQFMSDDAIARNGESSTTLKPIPVLLMPGETTEQYETKFRRWVFNRKVSTELLESEPAVERQYRLDFADSRAWTLSRKGIGTMNPHNLDKYEGVRSREELLSTEVMTVAQFVEKMTKFGPNGYLNCGWRLKRIPIVLRPRETKLIYELNFQRWLGKKDVTLEMLREDPEEERRYRQCFAYTRVIKAQAAEQAKRARKRGRSHSSSSRSSWSSRSRSRSRGRYRSRSRSRSWSRSISRDSRSCSRSNSSDRSLSRRSSRQDLKRSASVESDGSDNTRRQKLRRDVKATAVPISNATIDPMKQATILTKSDGTSGGPKAVNCKDGSVFQAATDILEKSMKLRLYSIRHLVQEYTSLAERIMLNEEVVMESLKAMSTRKMENSADAAEHLSQIKELVVCISKEKQRRDGALAAVFAHEYQETSKESDPFTLEKKMLSAIHGRLASIYDKLEKNQEELRALQVELKKHVQCLNAESSISDNQVKEVQELANKLEAAMVGRTTLETHRQVLCTELLRLDGGIGMLASVMIEEATQPTQ